MSDPWTPRTLTLLLSSPYTRGGGPKVGGMSASERIVRAQPLLIKDATAYGVFVGSRADYYSMSRFMEKNKIHPAVNRVYRLEQLDEALAQLKSGDFVGKIVLEL